MVTQERLVEFPGGSENSRDHRRMAELRLIIIAEIGRRAGPKPLGKPRHCWTGPRPHHLVNLGRKASAMLIIYYR